MKKLLIIAICLFGLSPFLKAQMLNLNYQISLPMNQVKDFTDKASFRGFDIEYHQFLSGREFSVHFHATDKPDYRADGID